MLTFYFNKKYYHKSFKMHRFPLMMTLTFFEGLPFQSHNYEE